MNDIPIPGQDPHGPASTSVELIVHPTLGRDSAQLRQIVRYVEKLRDGASPSSAARAAGTTLGALKLKGRAVQKYLARAKAEYTAEAAEIREVVVLKWIEKALMDSTDPNYDARENMAALHELSLMPEVGLKQTKLVGGESSPVRVVSEEAQAILDGIEEA